MLGDRWVIAHPSHYQYAIPQDRLVLACATHHVGSDISEELVGLSLLFGTLQHPLDSAPILWHLQSPSVVFVPHLLPVFVGLVLADLTQSFVVFPVVIVGGILHSNFYSAVLLTTRGAAFWQRPRNFIAPCQVSHYQPPSILFNTASSGTSISIYSE